MNSIFIKLKNACAKASAYISKALKKFADFMKPAVSFVSRSKILVFSIAAVLVLAATLVFSDVTGGYNVIYGDKKVATVKSVEDYKRAVEIATETVDTCDFGYYLYDSEMKFTVTLENSLKTPEALAGILIDNTHEIVYGTTLYIDGTAMVCVGDADYLDTALNKRLHMYDSKEFSSYSEFKETVTTENGFYPAYKVMSNDIADLFIDKLTVNTSVTEYSETAIPYSTEVRKSDEREVGDSKVIVKGVNGTSKTLTSVKYVNGEEESRNLAGTSVVTPPTDEVIVIGTAPRIVTPETRINASSLGFIWPLKKAPGWTVSAYYGDNRNHKGVDIACKRGTPIYAAQSGKVDFAGSGNGYGNYVIIDHGNDVKTLYAHASKLYVRNKEYVAQGEIIGEVGATGMATGNHLHFEVHIKGKQVDPAPYIGLS